MHHHDLTLRYALHTHRSKIEAAQRARLARIARTPRRPFMARRIPSHGRSPGQTGWRHRKVVVQTAQ
jgi:hypothetical protein